jgi:hypothetical protein
MFGIKSGVLERGERSQANGESVIARNKSVFIPKCYGLKSTLSQEKTMHRLPHGRGSVTLFPNRDRKGVGAFH